MIIYIEIGILLLIIGFQFVSFFKTKHAIKEYKIFFPETPYLKTDESVENANGPSTAKNEVGDSATGKGDN